MAEQPAVVGGVDTHTDFHQAAVIDSVGRHLATAPFPTTPDGYRRLLEWLHSHGDLMAVGVEGIPVPAGQPGHCDRCGPARPPGPPLQR